MRKCFVFVAAVILFLHAACSTSTSSEAPLPPGAETSETACPKEALQFGGSCYVAAGKLKDAMTWYERKAEEGRWTLSSVTDDDPFTFILSSGDRKTAITFYRQPDDENRTGLLIKAIDTIHR